MTDESDVSDRLKALREKANLSIREMAHRLGKSYSSYTHYERRLKRTYLPREFAEDLAKAFSGTNVTYDEVMALAGDAPKRVDHGAPAPAKASLVPVYDVAASAGNGAVVPDYEAIAYSLAFPGGYLRRLTSADPRNLAIISVKGDSMEPTLKDDDIVMLDRSKLNPNFDGLFVLRFDDVLHVKRVGRGRTGYITIVSDNRAVYPPIELPIQEVSIVGKVIWYGRKV